MVRTGLTAALLLAVCATATHAETVLRFAVTLDSSPIGEHVFRITGPANARTVQSSADFRVRLLGLTLYRYHHRATEQWRGDCLASLQATTEDDAPARTVRAETRQGLLVVDTPDGSALDGCVMSFAYWHPALRQQTRLLNAQTGAWETVRVLRQGDGTVDTPAARLPAQRWRIEGTAQPVELWYGDDGRWLGLDATVQGGRRLSYRLADAGG